MDTNIILEMIWQVAGLGALGTVLVNAEPVQFMIDYIGHLINSKPAKTRGRRIAQLLFPWLDRLMSCSKCFTFWLALAFTWNPFVAALASLLASELEKAGNKHNL